MKPIFEVFPVPIDTSKLSAEKVETLLKMMPEPSTGEKFPDIDTVLAEL